MKNIVITGGLGFIGSNLIKLLIKKKFRIINIDNASYSSNFYNIKNFKSAENYKFIKCNIEDKKIYDIFLKYKPVVVFNLAAETHVDRSIDRPQKFISTNINGTFNLLECFKRYNKKNRTKKKLIHVSTDEVYGDILKGRSGENFPYKPSSPYAASKAASDHLVYSYVKTYGLPAIITNCSNNYGPRQHPEKLIPKLIYNIINNKNLPIYGKGINSREWIHVDDHCEALFQIFKYGKIGEFYNIGSNKNLNNLEITKTLLLIAKKKIKLGSKVKIIFVKDRPGHDLRYAINSNKIKDMLGWKPKIKFYEGLQLTFDWYLKNKMYYKSISKKDILNRFGIK